jgi:alpha-tubulin suppressor-like RCC1 family protein
MFFSSTSLTGAVRLSVGGWSNPIACAIVRPDALGELMCWGGGDRHSELVSNSSAPWKVAGLPGNVVDVVVGMRHACTLVNDGTSSGGDVYCWGVNCNGALGQGPAYKEIGSRTPLRVSGLSNVVALYAGSLSTCAVTADQSVLCWGDSDLKLDCKWVEGRAVFSLPKFIKQSCT